MSRALAILLVAAGLVAAGCGRSDSATAALEEQASGHEQRLAQLEKANDNLKSQVETLSWQYTAMATKVDARAPAGARTDEQLAEIVRRAIEEQMAEREAAREAERAEQRERGRQGAEERRAAWQERQLNELAEALKLDDEQKEKMTAARAEMREAMRDAWGRMREEGAGREGVREAMERARTAHEEAMKKILSEEQFEQYKKYQEDRPGRGLRDGQAREHPVRPH